MKLLLKGKNKLETISYNMIIVSAIMIALGVLLGSFVQGTIYIASVGALLFMAGICIYIYLEIKTPTEHHHEHKEEKKE